jgi:nucleotide-binding universal stress UspA family protein
MAMIKHILFPFDFSKQGLLAAPFVSTIAKRFEARITLLSIVAPVWSVSATGIPAVVGGDTQQVEHDLRSSLDVALTQGFVDVSVQRVASSGDPALKITEFAHDNAVDLIMVPTHGFGLFRSLLIGSVTAKILHDVKCPVWTATHAEEQHAPPVPKTILCAVDGTPKTPALLQWAAEFSQHMGATLKLLHVVPPITDWIAMPGERELQDEVREEARAKIEGLRRSAGVELPVRIAVGPVSGTVTEEAREEGADLILIGRGSLQESLGRLRTHAYGIIQKAPCPVLSV